MKMRVSSCFVLFLLSGASLAAPASSTTAAPAPLSTACGDIVNSDNLVFNASLAYDCLTSVPFNPAVATRFLQYYNDTLQFQSTLQYLKNPPTSYQQPGVDLLAGLNELQRGINSGIFPNQYEFEAALQTLLYAAHDGHVNLIAGILAAFSFGSPYDVVSLSIDGKQLPNIYLADDVDQSEQFTTYLPSAIKSINGEEVVTYLKRFAAKNSIGMLESNTDFNQLMFSNAQDIQGIFNVFSGGATFYPGDTITFVLENGTTINDRYLAIYNSQGPTGPLETGGDFYNFFVLGFYPASFDPDSSDDTGSSSSSTVLSTASTAAATATVTSSAAPTPSNWDNSAYPSVPDVAQPDLGTYGGGFVSGYFLNSTSVAVLSIPSFDEYGDALDTFHNTTAEFLVRSRAAGLQKIVIDLQQNSGGQALLAIDTFKQFFPNINPFGGSRMRAHASADVMGETITDYFISLNDTDDNYDILVANEWVATTRINADTGRDFTSWSEFFGPHLYNGDNFTTTQQYNLSNPLFDTAATDEDSDFLVYGYANPATSLTPPYAASDIVILSDGICESSCALFMEMMHHEAGVRVVVAGGNPSTGPMQAPAGSRGARSYPTDILDPNIDFAQQILKIRGSPEVNFLPNRTDALDVFVTYANVNLRDQVRKNETIPLQFAYEAADCRIFYTPKTYSNYTALWQYAANAIWSDSSLCVAGSTGFATTGTNLTDFVGPPSSTPGTFGNLTAHLTSHNTSSLPFLLSLNDNLEDGGVIARNNRVTALKPCDANNKCQSGFSCTKFNSCQAGVVSARPQCLPICHGLGSQTPCGGQGQKCQLSKEIGVSVGSQKLREGVCPPAAVLQKCSGTTTLGFIHVGPAPGAKKRGLRH